MSVQLCIIFGTVYAEGSASSHRLPLFVVMRNLINPEGIFTLCCNIIT